MRKTAKSLFFELLLGILVVCLFATLGSAEQPQVREVPFPYSKHFNIGWDVLYRLV